MRAYYIRKITPIDSASLTTTLWVAALEICIKQSQRHMDSARLLVSQGGVSWHEGWRASSMPVNSGFQLWDVTSTTRTAKEKTKNKVTATKPSWSHLSLRHPRTGGFSTAKDVFLHQLCFQSSNSPGKGSPRSPPPPTPTTKHIYTKVLKCQQQWISVGTERAIFSALGVDKERNNE